MKIVGALIVAALLLSGCASVQRALVDTRWGVAAGVTLEQGIDFASVEDAARDALMKDYLFEVRGPLAGVDHSDPPILSVNVALTSRHWAIEGGLHSTLGQRTAISRGTVHERPIESDWDFEHKVSQKGTEAAFLSLVGRWAPRRFADHLTLIARIGVAHEKSSIEDSITCVDGCPLRVFVPGGETFCQTDKDGILTCRTTVESRDYHFDAKRSYHGDAGYVPLVGIGAEWTFSGSNRWRLEYQLRQQLIATQAHFPRDSDLDVRDRIHVHSLTLQYVLSQN